MGKPSKPLASKPTESPPKPATASKPLAPKPSPSILTRPVYTPSAHSAEFGLLCHIIGDTEGSRIKIVSLLHQSEMSVGEIALFTGMSISSASQHLKKLKAHGIVIDRRESQKRIYSLDGNLAERLLTLVDQTFPG